MLAVFDVRFSCFEYTITIRINEFECNKLMSLKNTAHGQLSKKREKTLGPLPKLRLVQPMKIQSNLKTVLKPRANQPYNDAFHAFYC